MPFTPSHAVVALPFLRTPLVPAAVAVGAMTPDLPLFVRGTPLSYELTHTFVWLPLTVAVALVLLLVWRCVLRPAIGELSPDPVARRLPREWDEPFGTAVRRTFAMRGAVRASLPGTVVLLTALAIGVASHIAWDLFTHEGRWGVTVLPLLDAPWGPLAGYRWLQYASTVIGLAILAGWALRWLHRADAATTVVRALPSAIRWSWWASLPIVLAAAWVLGLATLGPLTADFTVAHLAYRVLPPACALWGALTVVLCVSVQLRRARLLRGAPSAS